MLSKYRTWMRPRWSSYASASTGLWRRACLTVIPMHMCEKPSSVTKFIFSLLTASIQLWGMPWGHKAYPPSPPVPVTLSLLWEELTASPSFFLNGLKQWTIVPCKFWLCLLLRTPTRGLERTAWGRRPMFSNLKRTTCTTSFNASSPPSTCGTGRAPLWWWVEMDATSIRLPFRS